MDNLCLDSNNKNVYCSTPKDMGTNCKGSGSFSVIAALEILYNRQQ